MCVVLEFNTKSPTYNERFPGVLFQAVCSIFVRCMKNMYNLPQNTHKHCRLCEIVITSLFEVFSSYQLLVSWLTIGSYIEQCLQNDSFSVGTKTTRALQDILLKNVERGQVLSYTTRVQIEKGREVSSWFRFSCQIDCHPKSHFGLNLLLCIISNIFVYVQTNNWKLPRFLCYLEASIKYRENRPHFGNFGCFINGICTLCTVLEESTISIIIKWE